MKRFHAGKKCLVFAVILAVSAAGLGWHAVSASADADAPASSVTLSRAAIKANSSYITDAYAGVRHVSAADSSVACASEDSLGRVVVTGISSGSTTVSFWYKTAVSADWVGASLPVTVSGVSDAPSAVDSSSAGIVFSPGTATVSVGSTYTPAGIRENGIAVDAPALLWVTGSDGIVSVDKKTGKITALAAGTATIFAVDPTAKVSAALTVDVS